MRRNILISLVLLVYSVSALAAEKAGTIKLPNRLVVHEYRLENGLQLLIVPDHTAPVFTFQAWYRVGSADEKLDPKLQRTGLAHFFEHMMFRGSKKYPGEFFTLISPMGSNGENATTSFDRTNYYESLPKERLDAILDLEADRAVNLVINQKIFDVERGAVLGELKMDKDDPADVAREELWALAFDVNPYRYPIIGFEEDLKAFTVEDARYFYKTYYAPNNATLILLGDLDLEKTVTLVEKHYGGMKAQKIPAREAKVDPPQTEARRKELTHPLAKSEILLQGFRIPGVAHKDSAVFELIAAVLAYGDSSILEQELVAKGLASRTSAFSWGLKLPNPFMIHTDIVPGKKSEDVEKIIHSAIERIANGQISQTELERGRNQYLMQSYSELRSLPTIGKYLGHGLSIGNYKRAFDILEEVKKVTLADLKRVASEYLTLENSSTIVMRPEK